MTGFTFYLGGKDIFVETKLINKTQSLASKIFRKLINFGYDIPDNPETRSELLHGIRKANCEIRRLPFGREYYEISGDGFGGKGSFVDDGMTIIIHLD